jgi:hypothetical protein
MTPHVRPSTEADCLWLAPRLREADRGECELWGLDPLHTLRKGMEYSLQPLTVIGPSGNPAAIFGVAPAKPDATVWLLGTDELFDFPVRFLRQSKMWLDHINEPIKSIYGVSSVGNWVDLRNTKHIEWLRWVGFSQTAKSVHHAYEIGYFRKDI